MNSARWLFLAAFLAAPAVTQAAAPENAGASAGDVLQIPMGSRATGMGSAFTAVASDVSALYYNPAGLSRLISHEVAATFSLGLADNNINHFAYAGPVEYSGLAGSGFASVGTSLLFSRKGTIEINRTNSDGSFLSTENRSAGSDFVATVAYAERIGTLSMDSLGVGGHEMNNFAGIGAKLIHSSLIQQYRATGYAVDFGFLSALPSLGLTAGFAAQNLGSKMKFLSQGDPLPATFRYGVAYEWSRSSPHRFTLAADGDYLIFDKLWHAYGGAEYWWKKTYAVRMGYEFNRAKLGVTFGFGLKWKERYLIDYSWASESQAKFDNTHRFTLSYRFGGVAQGARGKVRRPFIESSLERESSNRQDPEEIPLETAKPRPRREKPHSRPAPREAQPAGVPGWIY